MSKKYEYTTGDTVRIKSGPFAAFTGKVEEANREKSKLKVRVNIKVLPMVDAQAIELSFLDVERVGFD